MKICSRCKVEKTLDSFAPAKGYAGGRNAQCQPCRRATARESAARRAGVLAERRKARYYADLAAAREKGREKATVYRRRRGQPERRFLAGVSSEERHAIRLENLKRHRERWPELIPIRSNQARRMRRSAEWQGILAFYDYSCGVCGRPGEMTVDHYIPLTKGGQDNFSNVWPICLSCNAKKHDRVPTAAHPPHVLALARAS